MTTSTYIDFRALADKLADPSLLAAVATLRSSGIAFVVPQILQEGIGNALLSSYPHPHGAIDLLQAMRTPTPEMLRELLVEHPQYLADTEFMDYLQVALETRSQPLVG